MSRVGKVPVSIPAGVTIKLDADLVKVSGPKGNLDIYIDSSIDVKVEATEVVFTPKNKLKHALSMYGTVRSLVNNAVIGVTEGFKKGLVLNGVGFTAALAGKKLTLKTGYSHDVIIEIPDIVQCKVAKTTIDLESPCKQTVGNLAAKIRKVCPPEPYLGKGIKYTDEVVRRKEGKSGK